MIGTHEIGHDSMVQQMPQESFLPLLSALVFIGVYLFLLLRYFRRKESVAALSIVSERREVLGFPNASLLYWTSPLLFVAVWGVVSEVGWTSGQWLPSPQQLTVSAWTLMSTGTLPLEAWISFQRVIIGFSAGAVIGVSLGLLAGSFVLARLLIVPLNSFLRYIPPTAFIALLIVYFGVGERYKYAVVFLGVIFFIIQMVVDVVEDIDIRYIEMAQTSGFSNGEIFFRVIIPYSLPRVFDVLRINLGASWTFLVAAELIGADRGLGHLIAVSQRFLRVGDLFVGILAFGVIGITTDLLLERASKRIFKWYYVSLRR